MITKTPAQTTASAVVAAIAELIGSDGEKARAVLHAKIGDVRAASEPIAVSGMFGLGHQKLPSHNPWKLAWTGGRPPFKVALAGVDDPKAEMATTTDARSVDLDISSLQPGPYVLKMEGANGGPLPIAVEVVTPGAVPKTPLMRDLQQAAPNDLHHALWLLMKGGPQWRLYAISRLRAFAAEHDLIAVSVLGDPR